MALLLLGGVGYAYYEARQREKLASKTDPSLNLEELTAIDLLPHERRGAGILSTSTTTITFYKGDYRLVQDVLQARVQDVLVANPWLGGWLAQKPNDMTFKLWYDPTGTRQAPYIFTCLEPGEVPLKRSTKYAQYNDICADFSVKVPMVDKLVGQNHPVFKVTVIPDAVQHYERFALVISMAHVLGDGYTYYQLFRMVATSATPLVQKKTTTVVAKSLNPVRAENYQQHAVEYLGADEATYLQKANSDLMDEVLAKVNRAMYPEDYKDDDKETLLFTIDKTWLRQKVNAERIRKHNSDRTIDKDDNDATPSEVLLSWWYKMSNADVAFFPKQLRDDLDILSEMDAGNFNTPIPLTKVDYETPQLVRAAIVKGRRCGTAEDGNRTLLPTAGRGKAFSIAVDWNELAATTPPPPPDHRVEEGSPGTETTSEAVVVEDLHIPLFTAADLKAVPNKLSAMILFGAKKPIAVDPTDASDDDGSRMGALIVAPKDVCDRIIASGIVDEDMKSSLTLEMANRRGSLVDFGLRRGSSTFGEALGLTIRLGDTDDEDDIRAAVMADFD